MDNIYERMSKRTSKEKKKINQQAEQLDEETRWRTTVYFHFIVRYVCVPKWSLQAPGLVCDFAILPLPAAHKSQYIIAV